MNSESKIKGVGLSHPNKELFPDTGVTKQDLARYYAETGPLILNHVRNRPLVLERYPQGIDNKGFYQRNLDESTPKYLATVRLKKLEEEGQVEYALCKNIRTLIYLVQLDCITPHAWLSRYDKSEIPDRMIVDLDPPSTEAFDDVVQAAMILRDIFQQAGHNPYVMTTGSRGLHVVVPIRRDRGFDDVREAAQDFCDTAVKQAPEILTTAVRKKKRNDKVFLDTFRNAYGQTAVTPYAVRARPGAPVATPLDWSELDASLKPTKFSLNNIARRLAQKEDPWKNLQRHATSL